MFQKIFLLLHTLRHLRPVQVVYQLRYRLHRPKLKDVANDAEAGGGWRVMPVPRYRCLRGEEFTFLNICEQFTLWQDMKHGALWAYNLNYFDYLTQPEMTAEEGARWIDRFVEGIPYNNIGLDPYPIALRGINWIKFVCLHGGELPAEKVRAWNRSLRAQYGLLERKLEFHLLGNHLLEDAYSLCIGAVYFSDKRLWQKAARLLQRELREQVLPDGAHYEQSPMYHCILLDRLLDVFNFSTSNPRFGAEQTQLNEFLREKAVQMLGHLDSMLYADGTFPLFNDAALGIAPPPADIKDYARRLRLTWTEQPLKECGYRHLQAGGFEAFVDVGGIAATYQPGHTHADALNFELRTDGQPFIIDTGISTYNKTPRRQYERSTLAHNTVSVSGHNSAEVWGGFRVGRRGKVSLLKDTPAEVSARSSGTARSLWHVRRFTISEDLFIINDSISPSQKGTARLHLAPSVSVLSNSPTEVRTSAGTISARGATALRLVACQVSDSYNRLADTVAVEIDFQGELCTSISHR